MILRSSQGVNSFLNALESPVGTVDIAMVELFCSFCFNEVAAPADIRVQLIIMLQDRLLRKSALTELRLLWERLFKYSGEEFRRCIAGGLEIAEFLQVSKFLLLELIQLKSHFRKFSLRHRCACWQLLIGNF